MIQINLRFMKRGNSTTSKYLVPDTIHVLDVLKGIVNFRKSGYMIILVPENKRVIDDKYK